MNILVVIRLVPELCSNIKLEDNNIKITDTKYTIDLLSEIAVEEALQIREKFGGEVKILVVTEIENMEILLRPALAMGADSAICIKTNKKLDDFSVVKNIFQVVKDYSPDIVFVGGHDVLTNSIEQPAMLAAMLDWNFMTEVVKINLEKTIDKSENIKFKCIRETEVGTETYLLGMPCIISVAKGLNEPRYPKLPEIIKSKTKIISIIPELPESEIENNICTVSNNIVINNKTQLVLTDSEEDVDKLADILKSKINKK